MKSILQKFILLSLSFILLLACQSPKSNIVLIGTVHQPIEHFNADSLYTILEKVSPDLILFEVDSSFFTEDFKFIKTWDSNENIAVVRYMETHKVDIRPYDFTGRNEHRIAIGSRPTDSKATSLLDSLYKENVLSSTDRVSYERFQQLTNELNSYAYLGAENFNNATVDSIAKLRQDQQYRVLYDIMRNYPIFAESFHLKADGDSVSYLEGFKRAGDFWYLRTKTMANNIRHFAENFNYKRIVVLNGYYHRFYIYEQLQKHNSGNYSIKEFYKI